MVESDRLSDLPDCILHIILSRLKARQVVRTCELSRRWRHLWRSAPCIDVDNREFLEEPRADGEEEHSKLEDFVDGLLLRRCTTTPLLHTLRLRVDVVGAYEVVRRMQQRFIRRGLWFSPVVLVVHKGYNVLLPPRAAAGGGTRRLTKLVLNDVTLHPSFQQQLNSGLLPVLEDLTLTNSRLGPFSRIFSRTLKNLTIENCTKHFREDRSVDIVTPRLASLRVALAPYHLQVDISIVEASSLVDLSIRFPKKPPHPRMRDSESKTYLLIRNMLEPLSHVSSLELSGFSRTFWTFWSLEGYCKKQIDEEEHRRQPVFCNLKTLTLNKCDVGANVQVVCHFLRNTPALEKLTLKSCKFRDGWERRKLEDELKLKTAPGCFGEECIASKLKLVELRHKGTGRISEVLSMVKKAVPATTTT